MIPNGSNGFGDWAAGGGFFFFVSFFFVSLTFSPRPPRPSGAFSFFCGRPIPPRPFAAGGAGLGAFGFFFALR